MTLLAAGCAFGLGLVAAALNARYRRLRQLIPIALQIGVFICPVAYATSLISPKWQWLYALNPMVGVIDAFRWCILGKTEMIYAQHPGQRRLRGRRSSSASLRSSAATATFSDMM